MAFRLMDFGIPNFDTNVDYLYKTAVEHGESHVCDKEEYLVYRMADTPMLVVLRFQFEADGETPANVIAHTFLDSNLRWSKDMVQLTDGDRATVMLGGMWFNAEVINPSAQGNAFMPTIFPEQVKFGRTPISCDADYTYTEGKVVPGSESNVQLLARVESITPQIVSKLWLFSVVRLKTENGSIDITVSRDALEKHLDFCNVGDLCFVQGPLSLMETWE